MRCISPLRLKGHDGKGFIDVPCGKCLECLQNKRADWTFRLSTELKYSKSAYFITLTYDDDHLPKHGLLVKRDLQLFFKKFRKLNSEKIKYYVTGEYGENTGRPHYHLIVFNVDNIKAVEIWDKGFIKVGSVTDASIHYVTKYIINRSKSDMPEKPFLMASKGLGYKYAVYNQSMHKSCLDSSVVSNSGIRQRMPRYLKNKIFNYREMDAINEKYIKRFDKDESIAIKKLGSERYFRTLITGREFAVNQFNKLNKKDKL